MSSISSKVMYSVGTASRSNLVKIDASFDPNGACKGGLRFVSITGSGTAGIYYVKLKNIKSVKYPVSDITDGDFSFDLNRIVGLYADISDSSLSNQSVSLAYDFPNNRIIAYVYDHTGGVALTGKLNLQITFTNNVKGGI
jgi:hypothetical protein